MKRNLEPGYILAMSTLIRFRNKIKWHCFNKNT